LYRISLNSNELESIVKNRAELSIRIKNKKALLN
jgi:hypothetical protein